MDDFQFSYELEGCPAPHVFSAAEACDLLNAFGGVYLRGDSLMRHLSQGLFILLSDSFQVLWKKKASCSGNRVFSDKDCRYTAKFDARELDLAKQFCPNGRVPPVRYQQLYSWKPEPHPDATHRLESHHKRRGLVERARPAVAELTKVLQQSYKDFVASLDEKRQKLSPLYLHGTGIHYSFDAHASLEYHIQPFLHTASHASPRPLAMWMLNPAPVENKPPQFLHEQGPEPTKYYNKAMKALLLEHGSGGQTDVARGAWTAMDFFNSTEGAASFDGTHYGFQVTMERTQMLLNYLDRVWGEIVELGGLVTDTV